MSDPSPATGSWSLRRRLVVGVMVPVAFLFGLNTTMLYQQALSAADTAYDRTLLASAKAIGEQLEVGAGPRLLASVPYSALEAFEADNRSRMFYKVIGFQGEMVSGFELPDWTGPLPAKGPYAALVHFYDAAYRGEKVRMAVLLQPVAGTMGQGMARIQVAETLELRRALAGQLLRDTLLRESWLLAVVALALLWAVQRATQPVRMLSQEVAGRDGSDLTPIEARSLPAELQPIVVATNDLMVRLSHLLEHQKRFVRDTSHQLRTPLAVLQTQVQSALRGDVDPRTALQEIAQTVQGATELANQMLALAKVEQLRQQGQTPATAWDPIVRSVALDLAPLITDKHLEFDLDTVPACVGAHEWALRELTRNLLHNAIRHSPPGGALRVDLHTDSGQAQLVITDEGPGITDELRLRLFQPFSRGKDAAPGSTGLGLSICREIAHSLHGSIALDNRLQDDRVVGLQARVRLPLKTALHD